MLLTQGNREEKESFWNEMFHLVSCIPQNEMVVLAGDMNENVRSTNVGYDGTHGGFGYGDRNTDGSRILKFAQAKLSHLQLVVLKVRLIILLSSRRTKHKLLVMDMRFNTTKRWSKKFEPAVLVWKLKEKQTCKEYQSMVKDR